MSDGPAPAAQSAPPPPSVPRRVLNFVKWVLSEHWFIVGIVLAIGLAAAVPDLGRAGGWIAAQYSIQYCAVIVIFILSGMSLKTRVLLNAAAKLPVHVLIQLLSLGLTPLVGFAVFKGLSASSLDQFLVDGLMIATAMPTTISTNVVFTKGAGGNEAIALINAVIGNIIGIFVSPGLLQLYLGKYGAANYVAVLKKLSITVIAPLVGGQIAQFALPAAVNWAQGKVKFGNVNNVMILLLVWSTFCTTFKDPPQVGGGSVVAILVICLALYFAFTAACLAIGALPPLKRLLRLKRTDIVPIAYCGATKTLALGLPLISVMYGDKKNVGILALPLLMYHAGQILTGNLFIPHLRRWRNADPDDPVVPKALQQPAPIAAPGGGDGGDSDGNGGGGGGGASVTLTVADGCSPSTPDLGPEDTPAGKTDDISASEGAGAPHHSPPAEAPPPAATAVGQAEAESVPADAIDAGSCELDVRDVCQSSGTQQTATAAAEAAAALAAAPQLTSGDGQPQPEEHSTMLSGSSDAVPPSASGRSADADALASAQGGDPATPLRLPS